MKYLKQETDRSWMTKKTLSAAIRRAEQQIFNHCTSTKVLHVPVDIQGSRVGMWIYHLLIRFHLVTITSPNVQDLYYREGVHDAHAILQKEVFDIDGWGFYRKPQRL